MGTASTHLIRCVAVAAVAVLLQAAAAAHAAEPALTADGACRDGVPNGPYQLRSPTGQLRVQGAFHMGKRTGTFIFWDDAGRRTAAIPYDEGERNGTIALWQPSGARGGVARRLEAPVQRGRAYGVRRTWDRNGRPRTEAEYVDDRVVRVAAWDRAGRPAAPDEARRLEAEDVAAVARELAGLEALIAAHPPDCGSGSTST